MNDIIKRPGYREVDFTRSAKLMGERISKINNDVDAEDVADALLDIYKHHYSDDGYTLCKELEDKGFYPDSSWVNELDNSYYETRQDYNEHIKKWVKDNNVLPEKAVGDTVEFKIWSQKPYERVGKIVKIYDELAQYVVGEEGRHTGEAGWILNFEDVK